MPQLSLEFTRGLGGDADLAGLMKRLHAVLSSLGGIRLDNCKSRWTELAHYQVGDGGPEDGFVHLSIRLLEGRSTAVREQIGRESLRALKEVFLAAAPDRDPQITVEVGEIARAMYFKHPEGTLAPP